ncbi:ABC transporter ATP-binding protein [Staphylococcus argensis]
MIEIKHLEKGFQKKQVLKDVNFNIPSGECTALIGKNGAGKSTLINILIGELKQSKGDIQDPQRLLAKDHLGILFQTSQFPKVIKVKELYHLYAKIVKNPISLKQFQDVTHFTEQQLNQFANRLSGGQQRILAFALAIVGRPQLLIMDEPTSAMDVEMRSHFWKIITQFKQQGTTIFYTSHYIEEVERMADRIVVLDEGSITT